MTSTHDLHRSRAGLSRIPEQRTRFAAALAVFGTLAAIACLFAPLVGDTPIALSRVFDRGIPFERNLDAQVFFVARLPRVLAAALAGSGLAAAGVVFQALFRNPLASPDTLGVSAGAALGAMITITLLGDFAPAGAWTMPLASFAGSLGALAIVYVISSARRHGHSTTVLLLAGVTLTACLSAVTLSLQYLADLNETFRAVRWLMGSLDVGGYSQMAAASVPLGLAFAGFAWLARPLDLISLGAESAAARGVDVARTERLALVSASLATGAVVSLCGPVGFIGIVVPHLVRLMVGADHRIVLPVSVLFGGAFLIGCDVVARIAFAPHELPVGIVTTMIGGPFFIWLLFKRL